MGFVPKPTRKKKQFENKSIYIPSELVDQLDRLAEKYETSFSNLVVSILEYFLEHYQSP